MGRKKVAIFATTWNADYLYAFLQGVRQGAQERNMDLYLFNTYGDSDQDYEAFSRGEYNIFFLPDLGDFDGVLMASNNVGTRPWLEGLMERIRQAKIPCVGVEQQLELDHYIGADNYSAMYGMVEYLVRDKGCQRLNYVGGPVDNEENCQRKRAFCDVLEKYGLVCDPKRIRDYSFRWEDGVQAYVDFKADGVEKTDAVVCANDYMAIGYLVGAGKDGLNAPDDFLITGFDNLKEAQQYAPRITSVDRAREELGKRSVCFLDDLIEKRDCPETVYAPSRLVYAQSTGDCPEMNSDQQFRRELFTSGISNRVTRLHLKHLRTALLGNRSLDDFVSIMSHYAPLLGIDRFAMGIDAKRIVENAAMEKVFFGAYDGKTIRENVVKEPDLIPKAFLADDGEPHTYLFSPCHCSGNDYGYCVIIDNFEVVREDVLSEWMLAVDNAVENLRQSLHLQIANKKLNELYRRDSLTGLYNRFALKDKGELLLQFNREMGKSTLIVFVDMDSLKKANDLYGHDMGDLALKTIADSIEQVCTGQLDFAVRFGGDEFLILGTFPGEAETKAIMQNVEQTITSLAAQRKIPFVLTASTGYTEIRPNAPEDLEYHIRCADHQMYLNKMKKR